MDQFDRQKSTPPTLSPFNTLNDFQFDVLCFRSTDYRSKHQTGDRHEGVPWKFFKSIHRPVTQIHNEF